MTPGPIISLRLELVEILMQALKSGSLSPFLISSSFNYLLTSATISMAADPTDFIVIAENQYGNIDPTKKQVKIVLSKTLKSFRLYLSFLKSS